MSDPIVASSFNLPASDGTDVFVYRWLPASGTPVRAVVQIVHGAAEHAGRYDRLARVLAGDGYAVYADDHRGHGRTAGAAERAGLVGPDAWNRMLEDERELTLLAGRNHPGLPIVLLGHSMGSMLGQGYAQRFGTLLAGLILSGTASALAPGSEDLGERVQAAMAKDGPDAPSMDFAMLFLGFNDPFAAGVPEAAVTGFEWLSRDTAEVALYVADPFCGFPFSNRLVVDMADGLGLTWALGAEKQIPTDLPVLLIAGADDPVGADDSVHKLGELYRAAGLSVTEILYPQARHEIFNETNRAEVDADVLGWLDAHIGSR